MRPGYHPGKIELMLCSCVYQHPRQDSYHNSRSGHCLSSASHGDIQELHLPSFSRSNIQIPVSLLHTLPPSWQLEGSLLWTSPSTSRCRQFSYIQLHEQGVQCLTYLALIDSSWECDSGCIYSYLLQLGSSKCIPSSSLLHLQTKVVAQKVEIKHIKGTQHLLFKLLELGDVAAHDDEVIDIHMNRSCPPPCMYRTCSDSLH
jgi:hypothetical protein